MAPGRRAVDFVQDLLARRPDLKPIADEHLKDHGEILPRLLMADVVRFLGASCRDRAGGHSPVSEAMATGGSPFARASREVEEQIAASFVENVPYPRENAAGIVALLPDSLNAVPAIQRGGGGK